MLRRGQRGVSAYREGDLDDLGGRNRLLMFLMISQHHGVIAKTV